MIRLMKFQVYVNVVMALINYWLKLNQDKFYHFMYNYETSRFENKSFLNLFTCKNNIRIQQKKFFIERKTNYRFRMKWHIVYHCSHIPTGHILTYTHTFTHVLIHTHLHTHLHMYFWHTHLHMFFISIWQEENWYTWFH